MKANSIYKNAVVWLHATVWLLLAFATPAHAAPRVALVVGNAAYADKPLRNPVNDAELMQRTLQGLGFDVSLVRNADRRSLLAGLRDFEAKARNADVALFYFAGHGTQVGGNNYLLPLQAQIRAESDVPDEAVEANSVLRRIEDAKAKVGLVILDACRDNPYAGATRSSSRGLGRMSVPTGSIVAYATAPGSVAEDGSGRNGVYTEQLARQLATPGLDLREVFDRTATEVERITNGKQKPREDVGLRGRVVLKDGPAGQGLQVAGVAAVPSNVTEQRNPEADAWAVAQRTHTLAVYDAFLAEFPNGRFSGSARIALASLRGITSATQPAGAAAQAQAPARPPSGPSEVVSFNKPVTLIVPFAAGGGLDAEARLMAPLLSTQLGVPVVVENAPGAGGSIGIKRLMAAPADGHTLMLHNTSLIAYARALPPGAAGYTPMVDLQPVGMVSEAPLMLVTRPGIGLQQVKVFASGGNGSVSQGCAQQLAGAMGLQWMHVPYRGTAPALADVMNGQVDTMCDAASTFLPHINSGKLQVAGLTSNAGGQLQQYSSFSRLPSATSGAVTLWTGLFAPKGTPEAVVNQLNQALTRMNDEAAYRQQQTTQGRSPITDSRQTAAGYSQFLTEDVARWAAVRMD